MEGVTEEEYDDLNATDIPGATKPGLSGAASRNHEELWPGYRSTVTQSDPELAAVSDNFAFDDDPFIVDRMGSTWSRVKGYVQDNANVRSNRQTLFNLVTLLLPYVGYPRTLNAISCLK
jgi:hypothetical protein